MFLMYTKKYAICVTKVDLCCKKGKLKEIGERNKERKNVKENRKT